jgi:hypothetical protein
MALGLQPEVNSALTREIFGITTTPEWDQTSNSERLNFLADYEDKLFDKVQKQYPGGWDKYLKDNPGSLKYLEDVKKDVFTLASGDIENQRKNWSRAYNAGGKESLMESGFRHVASGVWYHGAGLARLFGFEDDAEQWEQTGDDVRTKWREGINRIQELVLQADKDGAFFANELFSFAKGIMPFLESDDANTLRDLAEHENLLDDNGKPKWWSVENLANTMGHFARTMTIMKAMFGGGGPGPIAKVFGAKGAAIGNIAARSQLMYNMQYAISTGISQALGMPLQDVSVPGLMATMGSSFAALSAGGALSKYVGSRPFMTKLTEMLPKAIRDQGFEFISGRIADFGESLSNAVESAWRTGDPWNVLKNFPAALAANMLEELLIDAPGLARGRGAATAGRMAFLRGAGMTARRKSADLQEKLANMTPKQQTKAKQTIKDLDKLAVMYRELYYKRASQLADDIKDDDSQVRKAIESNPNLYGQVYEAVIQKDVPEAEAVQAATIAVMENQIKQTAIEDNIGVKARVKRFVNQMLEKVSPRADVEVQQVPAQLLELDVEQPSEIQRGEQLTTQAQQEAQLQQIREQAPPLVTAGHTVRMTSTGVQAAQQMIQRMPKEVQDIVSINEVGEIMVDAELYEEAYGEPYAGQRALGRFFAVDAAAVIELVNGSTPRTGYHEAFHFVQKFALTDAEQALLASRVGSLEEQAAAFTQWVLQGKEELSWLGKIFSKIQEFMDRMRNALQGLGFTSVNQIFDNVYAGNVQLRQDHVEAIQGYYDRTVHRGFLTPEGSQKIITYDPADFPDAAENNWVRKDVNYTNDPIYKIMEFTAETVDLIEDDLNSYTMDFTNRNVKIDTPSNTWIIDLDTYRDSGSLREAMRSALSHTEKEQPQTRQEFYDVEDADLPQEADKEVTTPGSLSRRFFSKFPFIRQYFEKWTDAHPDMSRLATLMEMPFYAAKRWPPVAQVIEVQTERERMRSKMFYDWIQQLQPFNDLDQVSLKKVNKILMRGDYVKISYTNEQLQEFGLNDNEIAAYASVREVLDGIIDSEIGEIERMKDRIVAKIIEGLDTNPAASAESIIEAVENFLFREPTDLEDIELEPGIAVRARDRDNIGTVVSVGEEDSLVKFINRETGKEATVRLNNFALTPLTQKPSTQMKRLGIADQVGKIERYRDRIIRLNDTIEELQRQKDKGYFPRKRYGKFAIAFTFNPEQHNEQGYKMLSDISKLSREKNDFTRQRVEAQPGQSHDIRPHYKSFKEYEQARDILLEAGVEFSRENIGRDQGLPQELKQGTKTIVRRLINASRRSEKDTPSDLDTKRQAEIDATLDYIENQYQIMDALGTFRIHQTRRKERTVLGYEVDNLPEVLQGYLSGYAGMFTKRRAAERFAEILQGIDQGDQPRLASYVANLTNELLRNADQVDRWVSTATSVIFSKFLGFNMAFHFRNAMQPWYLGIPTMAAHGLPTGRAMSIMSKEYINTMRSLKNYYHGANQNEAMDFAQKVERNSPEIQHVIARFVSEGKLGGMRQELFKQTQDLEASNPHLERMGRTANQYLEVVGKFVQISDVANRLTTLKTAYKALTQGKELDANSVLNEDAYREAANITDEANVVYKSWNTLPVFWQDRARSLKPLFTFQRYGWHTARLQMEWGMNGQYGPLFKYWLITALLGGAETLPFWGILAGLVGADDRPKLRKDIIRFLGGEKALFDALETGLVGLLGVDMRNSLGIRIHEPFTDPLMGNNVIMGVAKEFRSWKDDIMRGRYVKAFFENPVLPNSVKRIARAVRESVQGKTTHLGDVVVDLDGNPIRLTTGEAMMASMGFIPARIGRYYSQVMGVKALQEYWGYEKSIIGTQYKIARLNRDSDQMAEVRRMIQWFNREMADYEVAPVPQIGDRTLKQWTKASGSKRFRDIARHYYR